MIDRLTSPAIPVHHRSTSEEGVKNRLKEVEQTSQSSSKSENATEKDIKIKGKVEEVVKGLNEFLLPTNTSLKFEFHEKLNEYYVTVIDDKTKEIVREIPAKKMLDTYAAMKEYLGILVDKKI